MNGIDLILWLV